MTCTTEIAMLKSHGIQVNKAEDAVDKMWIVWRSYQHCVVDK